MGHQVHKDHQELKDILENQDLLGHLGKVDSLVHQVYLVKESLVKMAFQDNQVCQVEKATQGNRACQESQDCLDLVNQDSQDQRVIKEWVGHLDFRDLKEIKVMVDYLAYLDLLDRTVHLVSQVPWDPQGVWVHLVLKETVEMGDLKGLMDPRVIQVNQDYLVGMVCQETVESQVQEVHQDQVVPKEMKATKVYLACLVPQELMVRKDKVEYLVMLDPKVLKESQDWMVQQDQMGPLVLLVLKEIMVLLVHQGLQLMVIQVYLVQ